VEEYPVWSAARIGEEEIHASWLLAPEGARLLDREGGLSVVLELKAGETARIDTTFVIVPKWTDETRDNLDTDLELGW
jgi:hypothetical protein